MPTSHSKDWVPFASAFYFYYLYFLMRNQFGFSGKDNLAFAALNGLIYFFSRGRPGGSRNGAVISTRSSSVSA